MEQYIKSGGKGNRLPSQKGGSPHISFHEVKTGGF